jgi:oligopeptide/dipeptide ABC transporter ATP-binding protein
MSEPLLATKDLTIQFGTPQGLVKAVNEISFALEPREFLGLVGETGSGKSVLAWSLVGIVPPPGKVVKGDVYFQGMRLHGNAGKGIRRIRGKEIGLIVQNARAHLNPLVQVGKQIANAYRAHVEASPKEALAKAVEMLHIVAIPDPERRVRAYPHELSGGMAQRVMIAIAIIHSPKVLIADEPTMGLDVTIQAQILDSLADLVHRLGSSALLATRDMGIIANYCQRVGVLYAGQLVEIASVGEFFAKPRHPYSVALLDAISNLGNNRQRRAKFLKQARRNPFSLPEGCHYHPRCGFADTLCRHVRPELEEVAPGHLVRCHHRDEVATWKLS